MLFCLLLNIVIFWVVVKWLKLILSGWFIVFVLVNIKGGVFGGISGVR